MSNHDTQPELSLSLVWHCLIVAVLRRPAVVPHLIGLAASVCSSIEGGEPAYGVAASAIYVWLTMGCALALPVFVGALVYVPLKTIPRGAIRPPGLTSLTTLGLAAPLLMLMVYEDRVYNHVSHPLAAFIDRKCLVAAGLPLIILFGAFLPTVDDSLLCLLAICMRTGVLIGIVVRVPPVTSRVGQMCVYYITCGAMTATIYDMYDIWAMWWGRQVKLITQRL
jgi:hypothetical protein